MMKTSLLPSVRLISCFLSCLLSCFILFNTSTSAQSFIRDAEIEKLLWDYTNPILEAAGLNKNDIYIGLIGEKDINAFVMGGENIFFHAGLLMESETPNMVIGVIAHEVGHIKGRHLATRNDIVKKSLRPMIVGALLGIGALIGGGGIHSTGFLHLGQQVAERNFLAHTRIQESSADQAAIKFLALSKQSPLGLKNITEKLAKREAITDRPIDPYARTHPMSRERVEALEEAVRQSPYTSAKDSEELMFRHNMAKAKLFGFLYHPQTTYNRYKGQANIPAYYALTIANYRAHRTKLALNQIDQLINMMPNNPYFYELKGQILFENGQVKQAILPYQKAAKLAPQEPLILISLAATQLATARANEDDTARDNNHSGRQEAEAYAKQAIHHLKIAMRYEQNPSAYFQIALAYGYLGDIGRAELATAERFFIYGNYRKSAEHARRAYLQLEQNTPSWIRAQDIIKLFQDKQKASKSRP